MSRIYIGRLSYNAREKDVERFFRGFGRIRDINLKNGFGFVVSLSCLCFFFFLLPIELVTMAISRNLMTLEMLMMLYMS